MAMPPEAVLKKMRAKLAKVKGSLAMKKNPTPVEQLRWDICQEFIKYALKNHLKSQDLAEQLQIHDSDMSRILRHRIERFSTDKLLELLMRLQPSLQIRLKSS